MTRKDLDNKRKTNTIVDYPNMNYCAAENTLRAINQLIDLINDGEKNEEEYPGINRAKSWESIDQEIASSGYDYISFNYK